MAHVESTTRSAKIKSFSLFNSLGRGGKVLAVGAVVFIALGLLAFIRYSPTTWGDIAGPLFSLGSGLLFMVALIIQSKDHLQAITEMEQTNRNHAAMLRVARQEKEFNTIMVALNEFREYVGALRKAETTGIGVLARVLHGWEVRLSVNGLVTGLFPNELFLTGPSNIKALPHLFIMLRIWRRRRYLNKALDEKDLQEDDRAYLQECLNTFLETIDDQCQPYFHRILVNVQELYRHKPLLEQRGVDIDKLKDIELTIRSLDGVDIRNIVPPTPSRE